MKQKKLERERQKKAENSSNENKTKSVDKNTTNTTSTSASKTTESTSVLPTPSSLSTSSKDSNSLNDNKKTYHPLTPTTSPLSNSMDLPNNESAGKNNVKIETKETKKRSLDSFNNLMDDIQNKKIKPEYNEEMKNLLNNLSANDIKNIKVEKINETIDFLKDLNEQISMTTGPNQNMISPICNYSPISNQEEVLLNPQVVTTTIPSTNYYTNVTQSSVTTSNTIQQPIFKNCEQMYDDVITSKNSNSNGNNQPQQYAQFMSNTKPIYNNVPSTTTVNQPIILNKIQPIPGQIITGNDIQPIPAQVVATSNNNVPQQYMQIPNGTIQPLTNNNPITTTVSQNISTTSVNNIPVTVNSTVNEPIYTVYVSVPNQTQNIQAQPVQSIQSVQPVQPVQPVQTVQPVQPVQQLQQVQSIQTVQTVQPVQPMQSVQSVQQVQQVQQVHPVQPSQTISNQIPILINTTTQVQSSSIIEPANTSTTQFNNFGQNINSFVNVGEHNVQKIVYNRVYIEDENMMNNDNMSNKITTTTSTLPYQTDNPYIYIRSTPGLSQYNDPSITMLSPKMIPTMTLNKPMPNTTIIHQSPTQISPQPQVAIQSNTTVSMNAPISNNGKMPAVLLVQQPHVTITNPTTNVLPVYTMSNTMKSNKTSELENEILQLKDKIKDIKRNTKSDEIKTDKDISLLEQRLSAFTLDTEDNPYSYENNNSFSNGNGNDNDGGDGGDDDIISEDEDTHLRPMNQNQPHYIKTKTTTASGSIITQMKPVENNQRSKGKQNVYSNIEVYSSYKPSEPSISYQEALFNVVDTEDLMADDVILNDDEILINDEEEKPTYTSFSASKISNSISHTTSYSDSFSSTSTSSSPILHPKNSKLEKQEKRTTISMLPKSRYSIIKSESPLVNHSFNDKDSELKKYINSPASFESSTNTDNNKSGCSPLNNNANNQREYHQNLIEKMIEILNQKKSVSC